MSRSSAKMSSENTETSGKSVERSESVDNICPVCHDPIDVFAVGPCDHNVCYRCSTRMRVLCDTMDCPICRSLMPQVAFVWDRTPFKDISLRDCIPNRKYKIFFQDEDIEDKYLDLLEFKCRVCPNHKPDRTFAQLQTHMRKEHQLFTCDLCVSHLKIFPYERKFYTRKNLALHRRVGDADDKSYKGHPLCEFCDTRFFDKDELLKHLRKDHYFCHFCDQQGSNAYYDTYNDLLKHFAEHHYLCTEGECGDPSTRFTHAFNSEIDLKAHKAAVHNKSMSKAQSREARTIEVDFQYGPRRQANGRGNMSDNDNSRGAYGGRGRGHDRYNNRRRERHDEELQRAIDASLEASEARPPVEERVPDPIHDFPSLNGAPVSTPVSQASAATYAAPATPVEDFPSLSAVKSKGSKAAPPPPKAYSSIMTFSTEPQPAKAAPAVKESKPVSLGTVSKVPKDRWASSAPKKTMEDYPALGASSGASSMSNGSWVTPPAQPNVSLVSSKPTSAPSHSSRKNVVKNISDENEFPSLGGSSKKKDNSVFRNPFGSEWANSQSSQKKAPQIVSRKDKVDNTFELPDSYFKAYEPPTAASDSDSQVLTNGISGDNQQKAKPVQSAPSSDKSDFPTLPARTQKEQKGIGGGDKKKKKNKKTEERTESYQKTKKSVLDSGGSLNDIALALVSNGSSNHVSNGQRNGSPKPKPTDWFDNPPVAEPTPDNNFPSLHSMTTAVQHPKPPPGFKPDPPPSAPAAAAPPGFKPQPKGNQSISSTPPGFSGKAPSSQSPAINFSNSVYIQPPDFKSRNLQLVQDIRESLETVEDGFSTFRALSGQFRQGGMEASDYFFSCQDLMGEADFARIFPELIGLLPDIKKQRELFEIYQVISDRPDLNGTHPRSASEWKSSQVLWTCPVCGQIVLKQDRSHHELSCITEGEFPTLESLSLQSDVAPGGLPTNGKAPARMTAKGAWIKAK